MVKPSTMRERFFRQVVLALPVAILIVTIVVAILALH